MGESLPIKLYETLVTLLGMYTFRDEEVLVLEAVANGIDAKGKKIEIRFEKSGDERFIIFHNDGPPMNRESFINYHTVSLSSKTKGESIGFAGVGAKIFLASSDGTEIITVTGKDSSNSLASRMYRRGKEVEYESSLKLPMAKIVGSRRLEHKYGTTYKVKLSSQGFVFLKEKIIEILQFWFNYALLSGKLQITVDGKSVKPWEPKGEKYKKIIDYKKQKIPCYFWISSEEVPEEKRHVVYSVLGKRIRSESVDFAYQIKGDMNNKVFCMADASVLAKYLNSNKEDFQKNYFTNGAKGAIKKAFYQFLEEHNLIYAPKNNLGNSNIIVNELTKRLDKILQNKDLKFLNPFSNSRVRYVPVKDEDGNITMTPVEGAQSVEGTRGGAGGGGGSDTVGDEDGSGYSDDEEGEEIGRNVERRAKGIQIITEEFPDDLREGWVDMDNRGVIYNTGHRFAKQVQNNPSLYDYNLARVVISALIKDRNDQVEMDAKTTLEYFERILHEVWI